MLSAIRPRYPSRVVAYPGYLPYPSPCPWPGVFFVSGTPASSRWLCQRFARNHQKLRGWNPALRLCPPSLSLASSLPTANIHTPAAHVEHTSSRPPPSFSSRVCVCSPARGRHLPLYSAHLFSNLVQLLRRWALLSCLLHLPFRDTGLDFRAYFRIGQNLLEMRVWRSK
jgi:hypothetical protein